MPTCYEYIACPCHTIWIILDISLQATVFVSANPVVRVVPIPQDQSEWMHVIREVKVELQGP